MESTLVYATDPLPTPDQHADRAETAPADVQPTVFHVLWGVTVLGLLLVSIRAFGLTQAQVGQLVRGPHGGNYWLLKLTHIGFDNTLPGLLALLFGAGCLRYLISHHSPGHRATATVNRPELYLRWQLWLGALGVVNAFVLLSPTDWLFQLGLTGILLFPLQRLSARALLVGAVMTALIFSGKTYWNYTEQREKFIKYEKVVALEKKTKKVKLTDEQKDDKSAWEEMTKSVAYDKKKDRAYVTSLRADYGTAWESLLRPLQGRHAWQFYKLGIWEIMSMALLGMGLFRLTFFSEAFSTNRLIAVAVIGLVAGQTLAWLAWPAYEGKLIDFTKLISTGSWPLSDWLQPVERALSAVGLVALVLLFRRVSRGAGMSRAVGAVGQLALTNYLLQTVFCSVFFYGYGFGYFGDLQLQTLYVVVAEIWLLQLVFSLVWLRHFQLGPAEWLLSSLMYGRVLPIRYPNSTPVLS